MQAKKTSLIVMFSLLVPGLRISLAGQDNVVQRARAFVTTTQDLRPVPDLSWLNRAQASRVLIGFNLRPGNVTGDAAGPLVISQSPRPGQSVAAGSQVDFQLGRPQLVLSVDSATPRANQAAVFSLRFEPSLPKSSPVPLGAAFPAAMYHIYWNDGSQPSPLTKDDPTGKHQFSRPGGYRVYAVAQARGIEFVSNSLVITAGFQSVTLRSDVLAPKAGTTDRFTAEATPEPVPGTNVEYCFHWGDDSPDSCGSSPSAASHVYASSGLFRPTVLASVNRVATLQSPPVQVQVQPAGPVRLVGPRQLDENQPGTFTVELSDQPAAIDRVRYCFRWEERAPPSCQDSPIAEHRFDVRGRYRVSAEVIVNDVSRPVGSLAVVVSHIGVLLTPGATRLESGQTETLRARLRPPPPPGSTVEYCFRWNDGTPDSCQTDSSAVHVYSSRGTYEPWVDVRINDVESTSSGPVRIDVVLPIASIALIAVVVVGPLAAGYGLYRLLNLRVTSHLGTPHYRIANPASLNKGPVVRIRCVCPPAAVAMIQPRSLVNKKKEASHA